MLKLFHLLLTPLPIYKHLNLITQTNKCQKKESHYYLSEALNEDCGPTGPG